ncbi:MAG: hypothetical protein QF442_00310, partial [Candidatus Peribacteraceae bacterium]|nr:hypothetical protein [Candidatus Peribacteraceae bacterium]
WVSVDEGNTLPAGETIINPRPSSQPKSGYEGWEQKPDWRGDEHPEQRPDNEDFGGEGLEAA